MARAMYHEAGVYLLDDPLSAVDAHVAKHIFNKCIQKYLREKARILVTHQLQYLPYADRILILKEGRAFAYGTYDELVEKGIDFNNFITKKETPKTSAATAKKEAATKLERAVYSRSQSMLSTVSTEESISEALCDDQEIMLGEQEQADGGKTEPEMSDKKKAMMLETKASGSVTTGIYWEYIRASRSIGLGIIAFISMIASQLCFQISDVWITDWMDQYQDKGDNTAANATVEMFANNSTADIVNNIDGGSTNWFVAIYSALIVGMFVMSIIRTMSFFLICMRSSINIHNIIFNCILRCRISHFDRNPSGRILNRFSKDASTLDEQIPVFAYEFQVTLTTFFGIILVNAYTNIFLIIPGLAIIPFIIYLRQYYIYSCRDIRRLESIARSPVYSHFGNTLSGLTTLRSFGVQKWFLEYFNRVQDTHTAAFFLTFVSTRGFGIVIDLGCWLYIIATVLLVLLFPGSKFSPVCFDLFTSLSVLFSVCKLRWSRSDHSTHADRCHPVGRQASF